MAAKNFFASFRLFKRLHRTTKWISENNTNRLTAFMFERAGMKSAYPCVYHVNSAVSSRNDSVIRVSDCYQEENCKNTFTFLPLTILLLSVLNSTAAYCGETEEKSEKTPTSQQRKLPFFLSRAATAAKRKAQTEVARAERCKRRLFTSETDKENIPTSAEPRILRQRSRETQNNNEMVSINCGDLLFYRYLFSGCLKKKKKTISLVIKFCLFQQLPDSVGNSKAKELSGYRIIDLGFLQQSLKSCHHCKTGKKKTPKCVYSWSPRTNFVKSALKMQIIYISCISTIYD